MILPIQQFEEVRQLIRRTHYQTLQFANATLSTLYWQTGHYLSERIANDGWGKAIVLELSRYIAQKNPRFKGFPIRIYGA